MTKFMDRAKPLDGVPRLIFASCSHYGVTIMGTSLMRYYYPFPVEEEYMEDNEDKIESEHWSRIQEKELKNRISSSGAFVRKVNHHGFRLVFDGIEYAPRFRILFYEHLGEKSDWWIHFLAYLGIECTLTSRERKEMQLDFTSLRQRGLMFRHGKVKKPVEDLTLRVKRLKRNFWEMID